jgi:hypothetical protein
MNINRKQTFAGTAFFLIWFCATLMVTAPALAAPPVGFSAVFLVLLAMHLITDRVISRITRYHRAVTIVMLFFWSFVVLGGLGGPNAALAGVVMTFLVGTVGRWRSDTRRVQCGA